MHNGTPITDHRNHRNYRGAAPKAPPPTPDFLWAPAGPVEISTLVSASTRGSGGDRDETIETIEIFLWFSLGGRAILQNGPTDPAEIGRKP